MSGLDKEGNVVGVVLFFICLKSIYFERQRVSKERAARERERIPSRLCTINDEPNVGLKLTSNEIMT